MSAVILTGEDHLGNTVKPRLIAAGADPERVFVLEGFTEEDGKLVQQISIPDDIPVIKDALLKKGARLLIIDTINCFLADRINSHLDHAVRRALTQLKILAEETGAAIVLITHLNKDSRKDPLYRIIGSIGNVGAPRSVLLVTTDPDDEDGRILCGLKANLSPLPVSLRFHLDQREEETGVHVEWDGFSNYTKDDLLKVKPKKKRELAKEFLSQILADGPVSATEIEAEAIVQGVSERTLRRASEEMAIIKEHVDPPGGHWEWSLPAEEDGVA